MKYDLEIKSRVLLLYSSGMSSNEISESTGIPRPTITVWVRNAGINRNSKEAIKAACAKGRGRAYGFSKEEQISALYASGMSSTEVAAGLGLSRWSVGQVLERKGVRRTSAEAMPLLADRIRLSMRKYEISDTVMDSLDENKAWVLGALFGDGCMRRWKGRLTAVNLVGDQDVCEKAARILETTTPVKKAKNKEMWDLTINSPILAANLAKWGLTPHKSHTMRFPWLPLELYPHFLRGYWDADGCVCWQQKGKVLTLSFSCMSHDFASGVMGYIQHVTGTKGKINDIKSVTNGYSGSVSSEKARVFAEHLWKTSQPENRGARKYSKACQAPVGTVRTPCWVDRLTKEEYMRMDSGSQEGVIEEIGLVA